MEEKDKDSIVLPGDSLGVEEEYLSDEHTFIDKGIIRAAAVGKVKKEDGRLSLEPFKLINKIQNNMIVIGKIVNNVGSAVFVKIDDIKIGKEEYLAIDDGKIIMKKGYDHTSKPCSVGDIVLARVLDNEDSTYILDIYDYELGVIFSTCPLCGKPMVQKNEFLTCNKCKYSVRKKISKFYMDTNKIIEYLESENKRILENKRMEPKNYREQRNDQNQYNNYNEKEEMKKDYKNNYRRRDYKPHHYNQKYSHNYRHNNRY
ncbi:MAG: exosome complex RNA-binding protein Csl4 [Candidatus Micrarchaeia archaeon]